VTTVLNRTHSTCGAAAGAWLGVAIRPEPVFALLGVGLATLAAFTPDLDHPLARPVKALGPAGWVVCRLLRFVSELTTHTTHRGFTHSLLFALLLGGGTMLGCLHWLPWWPSGYLGLAVAVGVVAALAGDLVTNSGLKHLMWPLGRRCRSRTRCGSAPAGSSRSMWSSRSPWSRPGSVSRSC
jgi:inner membrane protein